MARNKLLSKISSQINSVNGFIDFFEHQVFVLSFWIFNQLNILAKLFVRNFTVASDGQDLFVWNLWRVESFFNFILSEERSFWCNHNFIILLSNTNDKISTVLNKIHNFWIAFFHDRNLVSTKELLFNYILECFFECFFVIKLPANQSCNELRICNVVDILVRWDLYSHNW